MNTTAPIGIFDSGYGGLTILSEIARQMPQYDYLYLGDNARTPYGSRSFEIVYEFTRSCVRHLFDQGCNLVILACNTASAKALRTIQQHDLPLWGDHLRVLGVIFPTIEAIIVTTLSQHVGLLATEGTITSRSYEIELGKLSPEITIVSEACPMWVPIIENNEMNTLGSRYFVRQHVERLLNKDPLIDTLILGCTHYSMLLPEIAAFVPPHIQIVSQGKLIAPSLADYLHRHPEMETRCSKGGTIQFTTTEAPSRFIQTARAFWPTLQHADKVRID